MYLATRICFAAVLLSSLAATQSQKPSESLPTVEQCAADLHAWYPNKQTDIEVLRGDDLEDRVGRISACSGMAKSGLPEYKPLADDALEYDTLADAYEHAFTQRLFHFIQRHGEMAQFVNEDRAGKR